MSEDGTFEAPPGTPPIIAPRRRAPLHVVNGATCATQRPSNWRSYLRTNKNGYISDEANVLIALEHSPALQNIIRYNEFAAQLELLDGRAIGLGADPQRWRDEYTTAVQNYLQTEAMPKIAAERIGAALAMRAQLHLRYHPIREYLRSLEWDREERLSMFVMTYFGVSMEHASLPFYRAAARAWMISAIARVEQPGCQADYTLVLEGAQGILKSSALRTLAGPDFFSDSLPADLGHKDSKQHLQGKWIIELPELAQFKRSEIETVKAFLTRRDDKFRPPYGRNEIDVPRQCVFAATTNEREYLQDRTGNRRFWPIPCTTVDLDALARDRDQLWAEAFHAYQASEAWYLDRLLEQHAAAEVAERVAHDPWTATVVDLLKNLSYSQMDVSPGEILNRMDLTTDQRHARNAGKVAQILLDLGWKRGRRDRTRGQLYLRSTTYTEEA